MAYIATNDERFLKKDFLGLFRRNPMAFPILVLVGLVPIETGAIVERIPT